MVEEKKSLKWEGKRGRKGKGGKEGEGKEDILI